jgi:Protein of unknown function (DUF4238)
MPGSEPKAQHFVHRAYLDGFLDLDQTSRGYNRLWLYVPGKAPFPQRPDRVAKRNYFYCYTKEETRDFGVERGLSVLEDAALPALRAYREHNFDISADNRLTFAGYLALSLARVPSFHRLVDREAAFVSAKRLEQLAGDRRALALLVAEIAEETGDRVDVDEYHRRLTGGDVIVTQGDRGWTLGQMFSATAALQPLIYEMNWTFLVAPDDAEGFVTSDNPVALVDPVRDSHGIMDLFKRRSARIAFPISRNVCLYASFDNAAVAKPVNAAGARSVNSVIIGRADSQVYAPFLSLKIQSAVDSVIGTQRKPVRVLFKKGRAVIE